jgi:ATP-binding protein involved in chromosome partitioning
MFQQVKVQILGVVENMSYLMHNGERINVFTTGGGKRTAEEMNVHFLGEVPLDPQVCIGGDSGSPVALRGESDAQAKVFFDLARKTLARVEEVGLPIGPTVSITD